jgi:PLP dependent protein
MDAETQSAKVLDRCIEVLARIRSSKKSDSDVCLCGVTKGRSIEEIQAFAQAMLSLNQPILIAESYLKEIAEKEPQLRQINDAELHFIGPLQSNKVAALVGRVAVIQSISSLKLLTLVQSRAQQLGIKQRVFLQCNISGDEAKKGIAPLELLPTLQDALAYPNVVVEGLMTITRYYENTEEVRPDYRRMREVYEEAFEIFSTNNPSHPWHLSMGMSQDYHIAVEEGATMVRVGSSLF